MAPELEFSIMSDGSSDLSSVRSSITPPRSSSPLSMLSNSPPPPDFTYPGYPLSPPSSQESSECDSPLPDGMDSRDGQRPAKRRRVEKDSSIEYLDLSGTDIPEDQHAQVKRLKRVLQKRRKIVVIAGAGISASAGVPVFRSTSGIFSSLKAEHKLKGSGKDLFDASVYNEPETTTAFHSMVRDMSQLTKMAKPTAFHQMIASLAHQGRLLRLYTQNVDGIDVSLPPLQTMVPLKKQADGKWPKTIQLHGGLKKMVCSKCHEISDLDADVLQGPTAPPCLACVEMDTTRQTAGKRSHGIGRLRPRMVLYSERNPDEEAIGLVAKHDLRRRPDAVIVVGTTLKVPGVCTIVKEMCKVAQDHRDGVSIWINNDPPPGGQFDNCFDLVVSGPADKVAEHADLPRWDEPALSETATLPDSSRRTSPIPAALNRIKLPSPDHFNNSFQPPSSKFKFEAEPAAPPFSPRKPHPGYIHDSIEEADTINVLPTPVKSAKGSPPKIKPLKLVFNKAAKPATKVKKPRKPAVKKNAKPQQSMQSMNKAFKTSKTASLTTSKTVPEGNEIKVNRSPVKAVQAMKMGNFLNPASPSKSVRSSPVKARPISFPNLGTLENRPPATQ